MHWSFQKAKGHWVVEKLYEQTTQKFMFDIMKEVHTVRLQAFHKLEPSCITEYSTPTLPRNIASEEAPNKEEAVRTHVSRMHTK